VAKRGEASQEFEMASLLGTERYTIDKKGRVAIPVQLRRALNAEARDTFVVVPGADGSLDLYPKDEWPRHEEWLRELGKGHPRVRKFLRMLLASAAELVLDDQGRVVLPAALMKSAALERDGVALIFGAMDHIEVWDPARFESETFGGEQPETLRDLAKDYWK
jgi:MraZ protein